MDAAIVVDAARPPWHCPHRFRGVLLRLGCLKFVGESYNGKDAAVGLLRLGCLKLLRLGCLKFVGERCDGESAAVWLLKLGYLEFVREHCNG
jgi:hypothetical protein